MAIKQICIQNMREQVCVRRVEFHQASIVMPVTFGGRTATVRVRLQNLPSLSVRDTCEVLYPEVEKWTPLAIAAEKGTFVLDVPLARGCALVRFQH
jgi:hypothetical protein